MFNWDGCPLKMFDVYIEVGDVKESSVKSDECVFIELWIASSFSKVHGRSECENVVRRPVFGVSKQIKKLCGDKKASVTIMCDDVSCGIGTDTLDWAPSLYLLLEQLENEGILKHSMLYTKNSREQVDSMKQTKKWRRDEDKERFVSLLDKLDETIYEQAHCYIGNGVDNN